MGVGYTHAHMPYAMAHAKLPHTNIHTFIGTGAQCTKMRQPTNSKMQNRLGRPTKFIAYFCCRCCCCCRLPISHRVSHNYAIHNSFPIPSNTRWCIYIVYMIWYMYIYDTWHSIEVCCVRTQTHIQFIHPVASHSALICYFVGAFANCQQETNAPIHSHDLTKEKTCR